jgi:hypothetical protein
MAQITTRKHRPIAVFDEKTMSLKLDKKNFKKKFDDGTPITSFEIQRIGNDMYFVRMGKDKKGNCRLWQAKVQFNSNGQVVFRDGYPAQGCNGNPCSKCILNVQTGCSCAYKGSCNHWISTVKAADFGVFARQ